MAITLIDHTCRLSYLATYGEKGRKKMSFRNNIPKGANIEKIKQGIINSLGEPNHGKKATIKIFGGYYSMGYQSNYNQVPHKWVVVMVDGQKTWNRQFTGKEIDKVEQFWNEMESLII
jgi:hypothetical protein